MPYQVANPVGVLRLVVVLHFFRQNGGFFDSMVGLGFSRGFSPVWGTEFRLPAGRLIRCR
jgi:hypothetical protein